MCVRICLFDVRLCVYLFRSWCSFRAYQHFLHTFSHRVDGSKSHSGFLTWNIENVFMGEFKISDWALLRNSSMIGIFMRHTSNAVFCSIGLWTMVEYMWNSWYVCWKMHFFNDWSEQYGKMFNFIVTHLLSTGPDLRPITRLILRLFTFSSYYIDQGITRSKYFVRTFFSNSF